MEFRRSGQLDDRRRRVLRDEIAPTLDAEKDAKPSTSSGAKGPVRAYAPAVLDERQPTVADLIPQRPFMVTMLVLIGLTLIAAIEGLYIHLYGHFENATLSALDLNQRGSLAHWFASLLLAFGAALSLAVFSIRVHRVDDYRGRYRVWLWTTAALLWGSLDSVTGVHLTLNHAVALLSGSESAALGDLVWLAIYGLVFGGLGIRLGCELWPSLGAFASLCAAAMLYLLAATMQLSIVTLEGALVQTVAATTVTMLAHAVLVFTVVLFARHVHLDAQGRLLVNAQPTKKKSKSRAKLSVVAADEDEKPRKKAASKIAAASDTAKEPAKPSGGNTIGAAITAATASKPAVTKPTLVASMDADADDEDQDDEMYDDDGNKLSKSERRRLKKMARRDQQRRAA